MAQVQQIISLVKSLSKSEIRYFKMQTTFQRGDKVFLNLFELMLNEEGKGETKRKFQKKFPSASFEPACKHLYKMLTRSLRNFQSDKSPDTRLLNLITDVQIQFNKGILNLCFSEIERGKKLALEHEKFLFFLVLARMELQFITALGFPDMKEAPLLEKQNAINESLYFELFINKHSSLYEILSHRFSHQGSGVEMEKLNDLLLEEFQVNANKHYDSFQSDKLHLLFQSTYFMMTGNTEESLKEFYDLHMLFEKNTYRWIDDPIHYIYLLNGIINNLRLMGKYKDMKFFIESLKRIKTTAESHKVFIEHLICQHELSICIDQGKFEEGLAMINEYKILNQKSHHIPDNVSAATRLQLCIICFASEKYRQALKYNNQVLEYSDAHIAHQTYVLCRLLGFFIHLELGNEDILIYSINSLERKLKSQKKLFRIEKLTLYFLRKWLGANIQDKSKFLIDYCHALKELNPDSYEKQLLHFFNFIAWAEGKIRRKSFRKICAGHLTHAD